MIETPAQQATAEPTIERGCPRCGWDYCRTHGCYFEAAGLIERARPVKGETSATMNIQRLSPEGRRSS